MSQFPPPIIVDMHYGCAAILQWGTAETSAAIWTSVESVYYNKDGGRSSERDNSDEAGSEDQRDEPKGGEATETPRVIPAKKFAYRKRAQYGSQLNTMDEAMDLVMFLWSQSGPGDQEEPSPTKEDFGRERVDAWLRAQ